mmetsp:Transcript_5892/g.20890  ORF Transcript_5892/g.20890 Transcript_5892/m.20890 type:complete len:326 (-) Transcript_5892:14-991(-)
MSWRTRVTRSGAQKSSRTAQPSLCSCVATSFARAVMRSRMARFKVFFFVCSNLFKSDARSSHEINFSVSAQIASISASAAAELAKSNVGACAVPPVAAGASGAAGVSSSKTTPAASRLPSATSRATAMTSSSTPLRRRYSSMDSFGRDAMDGLRIKSTAASICFRLVSSLEASVLGSTRRVCCAAAGADARLSSATIVSTCFFASGVSSTSRSARSSKRPLQPAATQPIDPSALVSGLRRFGCSSAVERQPPQMPWRTSAHVDTRTSFDSRQTTQRLSREAGDASRSNDPSPEISCAAILHPRWSSSARASSAQPVDVDVAKDFG